MAQRLLTVNIQILSRSSRVHYSRQEAFFEGQNTFTIVKREVIPDITATTNAANHGCATAQRFALPSPHPLACPHLRHGFSAASCCRLPSHPESFDTRHLLHKKIRAQVGRINACPPTPSAGVSRHKRWHYGTQELCGLLDHRIKYFNVY